ncbi:hypothetical protein ABB37_07883 [Leptomonas pyrrhocoris]|uniref:Uncharacterized protein n=1 Tax=Leptomonas pyrrhocoris TaxID=157538 RepID=A0A0N0DSL4_LEPPY|nr:hypothetical protein ABB37_07883 [Leptomonas pyrrhocoris]KPA76111.1 hypothetical protein ABB37_07883 [Leptomonas pyrrhocoris]|eukprot:XP_015654550.1 hypothetical protein ABB37_07883 [Leptomonas pyrrhocoris]
MEHPPSGASRFRVVFGRNSGSRKQRAKREGSLSVGYHSSSLFDTDAKECVMVCKGTRMTPNRIFAKMQAARRGAAWTAGSELTINGFDVVIEEVMELHLIPYNEDVVTEAATGADTAVSVPQRKTSCVNNSGWHSPTASCAAGHGSRAAPAATTTAVAFTEMGARVFSPSLAAPTAQADRVCSFNVPVLHASAQPETFAATTTTATTNDGGESAPAEREQASLCVRAACASVPPAFSSITTKETEKACVKRARADGNRAATTAHPRRRARRSAASLARELRSSYPQYFLQ